MQYKRTWRTCPPGLAVGMQAVVPGEGSTHPLCRKTAAQWALSVREFSDCHSQPCEVGAVTFPGRFGEPVLGGSDRWGPRISWRFGLRNRSSPEGSNQPTAQWFTGPSSCRVCQHPSAPTPPVRPTQRDSAVHITEGNTEVSGPKAGEAGPLRPKYPALSICPRCPGKGNTHSEVQCALDHAGLRVPQPGCQAQHDVL